MRKPFTRQEAIDQGISPAALRWGVRQGRWQRVCQGAYIEGGESPTDVERALGVLVATGGVASHSLAGVLHELDSVRVGEKVVTIPTAARTSRSGVVSSDLLPQSIVSVDGIRCADGLQTLIGLAAVLDDVTWEHALESALRERLVKVSEIEGELSRLGASRTPGVARIRRVLGVRPLDAPPTESLLETLMVQLIRSESRLPEPSRQVEVFNKHGSFVARVDLAWPEQGIFLELDGQQHKGQPVYDARRETAVVAAKGWLPGRFTWHEVTRLERSTQRRLVELHEAAQRRPL